MVRQCIVIGSSVVQFSMVRGPASDGKGQTLDEGVDVVQLPRMNRRGASDQVGANRRGADYWKEQTRCTSFGRGHLWCRLREATEMMHLVGRDIHCASNEKEQTWCS